ncbi:MAG: S49 family peptidase [Actinomycetia bacterium]|nr:S49 family peptidase [Actinomycetes bacterium]
MSYGQFLGRAVTVTVLAPLALVVGPLILLFILLAAVGAAIGGATEVDDSALSSTESIGGNDGADEWILVVEVEGPILLDGGGAGPFGGLVTGGEQIRDTLIEAATDSRVEAVVVTFDTPGGSVGGSAAIAEGIEAVQSAGKPVVAHVESISASGGMWGMAPADTIVANQGSLIGSIGVIFGPLRYYDDVVAVDGGIFGGGIETRGGIDEYYITGGTSKDLGHPFRELTDDERSSLQGVVDRLYGEFVSHVAEHRPLSEAEIRDDLGALLFDPEAALDKGLIDTIGTRHDAWAEAANLAGLSHYDVRRVTRTASLIEAILFGASDDPPQADLSSLCGPSPHALAFQGDLNALCGISGP